MNWTHAEDAQIMRDYWLRGPTELANLMPGRSRLDIYHRKRWLADHGLMPRDNPAASAALQVIAGEREAMAEARRPSSFICGSCGLACRMNDECCRYRGKWHCDGCAAAVQRQVQITEKT